MVKLISKGWSDLMYIASLTSMALALFIGRGRVTARAILLIGAPVALTAVRFLIGVLMVLWFG